MVAGGRWPPSRKLWHLYRWSYIAVFDHQAPRATKSPSPWFYSARATKRAFNQSINQKRIRVTKVTNLTARPLSHYTQSRKIVCMTTRLDVTPKTTEQNLIVYISKSETEVTNNRRLRSTEVLLLLLLLLNEYYLHAVKQKSCKSMLQTWNKNVSG